MPTLTEDLRDNPTASLITIRCYPWVVNNTLLLGDASHGIVPFFGQGMNAGFEDCRILNELLETHNDNWQTVLPAFQQLRKPDTDAIAKLALDNFVEIREPGRWFFLRRKLKPGFMNFILRNGFRCIRWLRFMIPSVILKHTPRGKNKRRLWMK
jgi:kynurenine 3-monooxygenase